MYRPATIQHLLYSALASATHKLLANYMTTDYIIIASLFNVYVNFSPHPARPSDAGATDYHYSFVTIILAELQII